MSGLRNTESQPLALQQRVTLIRNPVEFHAGDWFNRLDFSYTTNNFGVGLPPAAKNEAAWPIKQPLLADPSLKPSTDLIKVSPCTTYPCSHTHCIS